MPSSTAVASDSHTPPIHRKRTTYWDNVARIGLQVAKALEHAHRQGVFHRDIKPANLLLDMNGAVWVTDFGLASLESDQRLTETGDLLGTLRYMAPESFRGVADARSETFSLGLTLYEFLTLSPAFDQQNRNALIDSVVNVRVEPIRKLKPNVPADLQTIVHKAIEPDPKDRYQTAEEFADDLHRFLQDQPIKARRVSIPERFLRWRRRNRGLAALAITLVLIVTLATVGSFIAAGYFLNLNSQLDETVGELETRAEENLKLAEQADAARRLSDATLADMHAQRGVLTGRDGDFAAASIWFAHAATLAPHDAERQAANRLRAKNWLDRSMIPLATFDLRGNSLRKLAFQPNGSLLMMFIGRQLRLWDWRSDEVIAWTRELDQVSFACWSPEGRRIAFGLEDGPVQIRDIGSGKILFKLEPSETARKLAWAPTGTLLATASSTVQVWDVTDQPKVVNEWEHPQEVYGLTFNQSGDRLVTACQDKTARLFEVGTESTRRLPLQGPVRHAPASMWRLAKPVFFDGDGKWVTIEGNRPVWRDVETGDDVTPTLELERPGFILSLDASRDGKWIAAGGRFVAMLWNARGESFRLEHGNNVRDVRFDYQSQSLLTISLNRLSHRWTLPPLTPKALVFPQREGFQIGAISRDGQQSAVGGRKQVTIWGMPKGDQNVGRIAAWGEGRWLPRISSDTRLATPGATHKFPEFGDQTTNTLTVVQTNDGQPAGPTIELEGALIDSCFCSNRGLIAAACVRDDMGFVATYEIATGKRPFDSIDLPARPLSIAGRSDANEVANLCSDGNLVIVDIGLGTIKWKKKLVSWQGNANGHCHVAYSPDGKTLVAVTPNNSIEVLDGESGERRFSPIHPVVSAGPIRTIDISGDSRWLATGVNGKNVVRVWDLSTGEPAGPAIPHSGELYGITSVEFTPDGRHVLSGHHDRMARLWDWRTGQLIVPPMLHPEAVADVEVTSDGRYAVTGIRLGTVYFWDLRSGLMIAPPADYGLPVRSIDTLAMAGDRLIVSDQGQYPLIDLSVVFRQPDESAESLLNTASVCSNQQLQFGELNRLEPEQWLARWEDFEQRTEHVSIEQFLVELERSQDSRSTEWIAERAVRTGLIEKLIESRPDEPQLHRAFAIDRQSLGDEEAATRHRNIAMTLLRKQIEKLAAGEPKGIDSKTLLATLIVEQHARKSNDAEPDERSASQEQLRNLITEKRLVGEIALVAAWLAAGKPEEAARRLDETSDAVTLKDEGEWLILKAISSLELGQNPSHHEVSRQLVDWLGRETLPMYWHSLARQTITLPDEISKSQFNELLARDWLENQYAKLSAAIERSPRSVAAYQARANMFKRIGKWDGAAADLIKATEFAPQNHLLYMNAAGALILSGNVDGYRTLCQDMLDVFQKTSFPPYADVLIKTCLLRPNAVELSAMPIDVLRKAASKPGVPYREFFIACCALYSYRTDDIDAALKWTNELANPSRLGLLVRAMTEQRLGRIDDAEKTLDRVERLIPLALRTLGTDAYGGSVPLPTAFGHDDQVAEILRREAAAMINAE